MTGEDVSAALQRITGIVGEENFLTDDEELRYLSQDYFNAANPVTAAIRPTTIPSLAEAVAIATDAGIAIFQRGGGYSYTDAYLPTRWPSIMIDTRGLDRIVEINQRDMFVTVEAGCTWAQVDEALAKAGLRIPCAGPQSGLWATIGGSISQGALGHGSGRSGISTESVLGLEVVLADGSIMTTGSAAQSRHNAFFRFYGPDVTGPFCQDSGALGIKATITLRLQTRPALTDGLSFVCDSFDAASQAIFPLSQAAPFHDALQRFLAERRPEMTQHNMGAVSVYSATSTNGFLYEPVFQWTDVPDLFHRRHTPGHIIERADRNEPKPSARVLASELKDRVVDLMFEHGGIHLQIGKAYPYLVDRDPRHIRLLAELKAAVDPQNLINPGALGLPVE